MINFIKKIVKRFKKIPESKRIIVYGKLSLLKNLLTFSFNIIVGITFQSWMIIAVALFGMCIGLTKNNCSSGLKKHKDSTKDISTYIGGGAILTVSSIFYIAYSYFHIYYPSNTIYNMYIALAIAAFATYQISVSLTGVIRAKGKTMLIKEYKLTKLAAACNNVVLAQISILSFVKPNLDAHLYNGVLAMTCGFIVLTIGLYLIFDGLLKRRRFAKIILNYPEIGKYLNYD